MSPKNTDKKDPTPVGAGDKVSEMSTEVNDEYSFSEADVVGGNVDPKEKFIMDYESTLAASIAKVILRKGIGKINSDSVVKAFQTLLGKLDETNLPAQNSIPAGTVGKLVATFNYDALVHAYLVLKDGSPAEVAPKVHLYTLSAKVRDIVKGTFKAEADKLLLHFVFVQANAMMKPGAVASVDGVLDVLMPTVYASISKSTVQAIASSFGAAQDDVKLFLAKGYPDKIVAVVKDALAPLIHEMWESSVTALKSRRIS